MPSNAAIEIALQPAPVPSAVFGWPTDVFAAWGQWAGGIGALLAVATTLWIMWRDRKRYQRELAATAKADAKARLKAIADEEARHAARARAVVAGPGFASTGAPGGVTKSLPWSSYGVEIANYSAAPVLEVMLEGVDMLGPDGGLHEAWLAQSTLDMELPRQVASVIAPNGGKHLVHLNPVGNVWPHVKSGQGVLKATFTFLDIEGYRWRRVGTDAPVRIAEDGSSWKRQELPGGQD